MEKQSNATEGVGITFNLSNMTKIDSCSEKIMDAAFSYDYYRLVLGKQIIQATFSNSEKLPQNHYK